MPLDPLPASEHTRQLLIGDRIRHARIHANLTQEKLGEACGVNHKTIHRIEYGNTDPSLTVLILISDAVGVPLDDLVRA